MREREWFACNAVGVQVASRAPLNKSLDIMKTRDDYEAALEIVRAILAEWDPYCLMAGGAPEDEFDPQAAKILTHVSHIHSPRDAAAAVSAVFSKSFGPDTFSVDECTDVGQKLFARLAASGLITP